MTKDEAMKLLNELYEHQMVLVRADMAADLTGAADYCEARADARRRYGQVRKAFLKTMTREAGESPAEALLELETLLDGQARFSHAAELSGSAGQRAREARRADEAARCREEFVQAVLQIWSVS